MKVRNGVADLQAKIEFVGGIGGVMEEGDVEVGVIGQQAENVITLAPNGNIKEGMQANIEVGETFATANVNRLKLSCKGLLT
jgi:hypothetical protein